MDLVSVRNVYRFYAPIYDIIFGSIVSEGRREAVARMEQMPSDRILEIGVGTGLSLRYYRSDVEVTGIDICPEMLQKAEKRVARLNGGGRRELLQMDAENLAFADNSFDASVAMYVASVVPDPRALMNEMFRVTKPGKPILVVSHFASDKPVLRHIEDRFAPFSRRLGFHPDFSLDWFLESIERQPKSITSVNIGGYWKLLEFRK